MDKVSRQFLLSSPPLLLLLPPFPTTTGHWFPASSIHPFAMCPLPLFLASFRLGLPLHFMLYANRFEPEPFTFFPSLLLVSFFFFVFFIFRAWCALLINHFVDFQFNFLISLHFCASPSFIQRTDAMDMDMALSSNCPDYLLLYSYSYSYSYLHYYTYSLFTSLRFSPYSALQLPYRFAPFRDSQACVYR